MPEIPAACLSARGANATLLQLKIIPGANCDAWIGLHGHEAIKVRLQAPPVEGAANAALVKFIAKSFSLRSSDVQLVRGEKSRLKLVQVELPQAELHARLRELLCI